MAEVQICGASATDVCVFKPGHSGSCSYNTGRAEVARLEEQANRMAGTLHVCTEEIERLRAAVAWNEEQRGIQAREIERLRAFKATIAQVHQHEHTKPGCGICEALRGA